MRLVTWNCCRGSWEAKLDRLEGLSAEVATIQECARPPHQDPTTAWFGSDSRQGIAIRVRPPFTVLPRPARDESRSMFAARVQGPVEFTLLTVWAQREPTYTAALHRGLDAYRDLLLAAPAIVMGDFNSSAAWDARHGRTDHRELNDRLLAEFGLVSAYHVGTRETVGEESKPTHYWRWQEASPFHLDYCYVPEAWAAAISRVSVGTYEEWASASDHRPLVVDLRPPSEQMT
jgi:exonuclease III